MIQGNCVPRRKPSTTSRIASCNMPRPNTNPTRQTGCINIGIYTDITPHLTTTASFFFCFLHPLSFCYSPEREKNMERVRHPLFSASAFCFRSRRSQCSCRLHKIPLVLFSHPTKKSRRTYESWPVNQHDATFKTIKGDCHVVIKILLAEIGAGPHQASFFLLCNIVDYRAISSCQKPGPCSREYCVCPAEKPASGPALYPIRAGMCLTTADPSVKEKSV
ncbi:hypothetical protein OUZ56_007573 [Daphnia magna]|uniref:Uncharacterized protein n=1 Tax=Daphnia magna TaxID=35525 RepID=A0ABR0AAC5_9CRUS|nr:hypothetical protein OUZ56_007573 [Daphnia magna]